MKFEIEIDEKSIKDIKKNLVDCGMDSNFEEKDYLKELFEFEGIECLNCDYRDKVTIKKINHLTKQDEQGGLRWMIN